MFRSSSHSTAPPSSSAAATATTLTKAKRASSSRPTPPALLAPAPLQERPLLTVFAGDLHHGPGNMRAKMQAACEAWQGQKSATAASAAVRQSRTNQTSGESSDAVSNNNFNFNVSRIGGSSSDTVENSPQGVDAPLAWKLQVSKHERDWRADCRQARVSLAPRGFGRTSYHLSEIVQLVKQPKKTPREFMFVAFGKFKLGVR